MLIINFEKSLVIINILYEEPHKKHLKNAPKFCP